MPQRVERIVIGRSHPNWKACARLCSLSRKLGNCAVYILRHRVFDHQPPLSRSDFDRMLRERYPKDYRAMPSSASAQRQGQIVSKQFKSYIKACAEYSRNPEKFMGKPDLPGYKKDTVLFALEETATRLKTIVWVLPEVKRLIFIRWLLNAEIIRTSMQKQTESWPET